MRRPWGWRETYGSEDDDEGFAGDGDKRQVQQAVKGARRCTSTALASTHVGMADKR